MNKIARTFAFGAGASVCAYFACGVAPAHATVDCNQYDTNSIGPNNHYVVRTNAFGLGNGNQQCIDWQGNGNFAVTTDTSTGSLIGFPDIMLGEAYGVQSSNSGLPIQLSQLNSFPVTWGLTGIPATSAWDGISPSASGSWDSIVEFWFNTTPPSSGLGQNDGAEVLIWLSYMNTNPAGLDPCPDHSCAGNVLDTVDIGGILWDVVAERWGSGPNWNYIAYMPAYGAQVNGVDMDFMPFLLDAQTRTGSGPNGPCQDNSPGASNPNACLDPSWYLTSVQGGIELFSGGVGFSASGFSAAPNGNPSGFNGYQFDGQDSGAYPAWPGEADWAPGYWKGECASYEQMVGLSQDPNTGFSNQVRCRSAGSSSHAGNVRILNFTNTSNDCVLDCSGSNDWDIGAPKAQCPSGWGVTGVAQNANVPQGQIGYVQCAPNQPAGSTGGYCHTYAVTGPSDECGTYCGNYADWDRFYSKGQCAPGETLVGISKDINTGYARTIRCCEIQ